MSGAPTSSPVAPQSASTEIAPALEWLLGQFPDGGLSLPDPLQIPPSVYTYRGHLQTSSRTQCRVRLWSLRHPDRPLQECIPHLLGGGLEFRMLSPSPPRPLPPPPLHLPRLIAGQSNTVQQYISNLRTLFSRPNSRRFLTSGGVLWRIALHYLSDDRVSPAEDRVAAALSGASCAASEIQPGLYDDDVTADEIAALVGLSTTGATLWPPPEVFVNSDRWVGQWTSSNEEWFQLHLGKVNNGDSSVFRTRRDWLRKSFQVRRQRTQNGPGSEGHAKVVCVEHDSLYAPFPPGRLTDFPL